jgi:hypothetical protein
MSRKPSAQRSSQAENLEQMPLELVKAIRADAFDQFIEERLQRNHSDADQSESDVVCHVY